MQPQDQRALNSSAGGQLLTGLRRRPSDPPPIGRYRPLARAFIRDTASAKRAISRTSVPSPSVPLPERRDHGTVDQITTVVHELGPPGELSPEELLPDSRHAATDRAAVEKHERAVAISAEDAADARARPLKRRVGLDGDREAVCGLRILEPERVPVASAGPARTVSRFHRIEIAPDPGEAMPRDLGGRSTSLEPDVASENRRSGVELRPERTLRGRDVCDGRECSDHRMCSS